MRNGLGTGLLPVASLATNNGPGTDAALNLDFTTGVLDSRITFTRASVGTYIDSAGLVQTASSGVPRFGYSNGIPLGLLIEETRTNLAIQNSDLTNAAWTASNVTTAKTATGPDGVANSATTLTATAANGTVLQAITSGSAARTTSVWIKRRTGTGTIDITQNNGTLWTSVTVTSAWTKVQIAVATITNPTIGIRIQTDADAVDVWGFQNEVTNTGAPFATSTIPTTTVAVARAADVVSLTGTNFSAWYNQTAGTFVVNATPPGDYNQLGIYVEGSGAGAAINIFMLKSNAAGAAAGKRIGAAITNTSLQAFIVTGADSAAAMSKIAFAYAANDAAFVSDGSVVGTDTSVSLPTLDTLSIGLRTNGGNALWYNGHIARTTYYNYRVPNAQMQALTA